jgi:quercetin dioxygenase-like cupin family protein
MTLSTDTGVEQLDLPGIDRELRASEPYLRDGHTARTLLRGSVLRVSFVVIRKGCKMAEHRAKEQSLLHVVTGTAKVHMRDRTVDLRAGQVLVLQLEEHHDVEATTDVGLMVNIGWRAEETA